MILSKTVSNKNRIKVTLKAIVSNSVFTNKVDYDFFAQIEEGGEVRDVYPESLNKKQMEMSVQEYVESGRCEFFKHVRPNHMFKLIEQVVKDE